MSPKPPIRVLLIEDNAIEAQLTQKWLETDKEDSFEVEWIDHVTHALDRLSRDGIDIIVSDLNLPDSRGLETFNKLHALVPKTPIVVLTGKDDESLGALAVEIGAQDYLIKQQVDVTKLARVLRYTLARHRAHEEQLNKSQSGKSSRVIGFIGAKGGVGTTTVALNVGMALAKLQKSVIVAEVRPSFGTLAYLLRQEPGERNSRNLLEKCPKSINEEDVAARLCKGPGDLRVLFGPQQTDVFKEFDLGQTEAVVKVLAGMADYVILDFPNQPSPATQAAVGLCQLIALVTERELGSVLCGKVALHQLQSWGVGGNSVWAIIVNRSEYLKPIESTDVRERLGCEILGVVPLATSASLEASISQARGVTASFVDIGNKLVADKTLAQSFRTNSQYTARHTNPALA